MNWGDWHWGFGFGHWIFGVLFWIVLLLLIVGVVRGLAGAGGERRSGGRNAREILEERYARGEIDREEFERKRDDISGR